MVVRRPLKIAAKTPHRRIGGIL